MVVGEKLGGMVRWLRDNRGGGKSGEQESIRKEIDLQEFAVRVDGGGGFECLGGRETLDRWPVYVGVHRDMRYGMGGVRFVTHEHDKLVYEDSVVVLYGNGPSERVTWRPLATDCREVFDTIKRNDPRTEGVERGNILMWGRENKICIFDGGVVYEVSFVRNFQV